METLLSNFIEIKKRAKNAREKLISDGYIYSDIYGWEKPEILEKYGLNPNMKGIPAKETNQYNLTEKKIKEKDAWGKETGKIIIEKQKIENQDRKIIVIDNNFINYYLTKKEEELKRVKQNIAKKENEIPIEDRKIFGYND
jgi:hypothetical protein